MNEIDLTHNCITRELQLAIDTGVASAFGEAISEGIAKGAAHERGSTYERVVNKLDDEIGGLEKRLAEKDAEIERLKTEREMCGCGDETCNKHNGPDCNCTCHAPTSATSRLRQAEGLLEEALTMMDYGAHLEPLRLVRDKTRAFLKQNESNRLGSAEGRLSEDGRGPKPSPLQGDRKAGDESAMACNPVDADPAPTVSPEPPSEGEVCEHSWVADPENPALLWCQKCKLDKSPVDYGAPTPAEPGETCNEPGCNNPRADDLRICQRHRDENLDVPDILETPAEPGEVYLPDDRREWRAADWHRHANRTEDALDAARKESADWKATAGRLSDANAVWFGLMEKSEDTIDELRVRVEGITAHRNGLYKVFHWLAEDERMSLATVDEMIQADVDAIICERVEFRSKVAELEGKMRLQGVLPFLNAVRDALDADRTNMVACTVGDLGVDHEDAIRAALAQPKDERAGS